MGGEDVDSPQDDRVVAAAGDLVHPPEGGPRRAGQQAGGRNEQRDGHLRTNDFLDAPNFPDITFVSTGVQQLDSTDFRLSGDLTIKDVTRPLIIDFEFKVSAIRQP
ncbi:YceI family protein [Streptomyces sp. NPDC002082]|uniref:YceI family protein n=1 Tax=Streptomyces sp. NPDC002082 TaxID=3154772 RepID=UPI00332CB945